MATKKLDRPERCQQTKARNEHRRNQFASHEFKTGKLTRKEIMHRL